MKKTSQTAQQHDLPDLVSGQQLSKESGVPYRSIYDLHVRGVLPAVRFPQSRRLWFQRDAFKQLVERSTEATTA
jgi:hypothetical protein